VKNPWSKARSHISSPQDLIKTAQKTRRTDKRTHRVPPSQPALLHQRKKFQHRKRGKKVAAQERFLPQESDRRTPETRSIDLKIHQEVMIRTRTRTSWHRKKEHTREVEEGGGCVARENSIGGGDSHVTLAALRGCYSSANAHPCATSSSRPRAITIVVALGFAHSKCILSGG
jgi:hypothetical protein